VYELYFGDENLEKHNYELVSVISNKEIYMTGKLAKAEALTVIDVSAETSFFENYKELMFILLILLVLGIMSYIAFSLLKKVENKPF